MEEHRKPVVLVVDDETDLRDSIAFDFKRKGYETLCASGGHEALEIIKKQKVDLIITDVNMPEGNGVELLRKAKEIDPEIPVVIFITGFADLTSAEAYDFGAVAVMSKPFDRKKLHETAKRGLLARAQAWAGEEPPPVENRREIQISAPVEFGQGGAFVPMDQELPAVGDIIRFKVELSQESGTTPVSGTGVVLWARARAEDGRSAGFGIEFLTVDQAAREQIISAVKAKRVKAFIPLGPSRTP